MTTSRRRFLHLVASGAVGVAMPTVLRAQSVDLIWRDVRKWGIEGRGWSDTQRYFDRLPARAEEIVRSRLWDLSRHSAGMTVRFVTDAPAIHIRYTLLSDRLALPFMPATGASGLDLYATDAQGVERWVSVVRPTEQSIETAIATDLRPGTRRYTIYLPLYNGVESLEIGTEAGTRFDPIAPRSERPMLFYGTSIIHGASASRPGMAIPAILGRRLNRPTINLGFAGSGHMEPEVGALLTELDPCVFAIDCLPNMREPMVDERAVPLVRQIREAHPDTPILLVEDRSYTNTRFFPALEERNRTSREALARAYRQLQSEGVGHLFYLQGEQLLGSDGEAATDGSHPSDLGMVQYADAYEPALRASLQQY